MKKLLLFITLICFGSLSVLAQSNNMAVGLRGGLSIPKIKAFGDNPMSQGYESRLMGAGGAFFEYSFSDMFSLRPGLEFSAQGGKRDGMQAIPVRMINNLIPDQYKELLPQILPSDYLYADFESETSFDYLMIPILAQFKWKLSKTSPFSVYANAGPFVSFLLSANQKTSGKSYLYVDKSGTKLSDFIEETMQVTVPADGPLANEQSFDVDESIKDRTNTINWGLGGNAGIAYQTGRHRIFVEGGGNYGFNVLQESEANGENRIGVGTVMIGYAFSF